MNFKSIFYLIIITLFVLAACERDADVLGPASFPTNPNVFLDGFSAGLNYSAFAGSKVTAFEVDNDVKYKGSASMRFEVPDFEDPQGAYAGGTYFTEVGRDLSGYDALTFWGKATQAADIDVIGFGNDAAELKYVTTLLGLKVNSNWKKYIIPIPDPSMLIEERGMFYYSEAPENDRGYTFWIDEVKFEKLGTVAHQQPAIMDAEDKVVDAAVNDQITLDGLFTVFSLPAGIDQKQITAPSYYNFITSDSSLATVSELGVVSVLDSGTVVITATLAGIDADGSLTINSAGERPGPAAPAPTPTVPADSVVSMFSNAYTDVPIDTWNTGWEFSTAVLQDIKIDGDDVKLYTQLNFVGIEFSSVQIDATDMTRFHMDIWTPNPTDLPAEFKVLLVDFGPDGNFGGDDDSQHEITFTSPVLKSNEWVGLDVPLSLFTGLTSRANLAQMVLSGDLPTVYVDNVYYYDDGTDGGSGGTQPEVPAPTPPADPANVISVYSDSYTDIEGTNLNPDWGQATVVSEISIEGNNTLQYAGLDYQGIELGSSQDVSGMKNLHLDIWSANSSALNVYLISDGPVEAGYALTVPTSGWTSVDIPLTSFAPVDLADVIQLKFDGNGDIFLDNIYFSSEDGGGTPDEPTQPAPPPTVDASNVTSVYSDSYTNIEGTNLNPDWGQATVVSEIAIDGNNTLQYAGLDYQGIELGSSQDVSGMENLHLDFWSANSSALDVFLISTGPVETAFTLTVPTSGWTSVDIPLTSFAPVDLGDVIQLKFVGNGDIYLDNIYFYKEGGGGTPDEPAEAAPTPTEDPADVVSLFSNAFTNVNVDTWSAEWDDADVEDVQVQGVDTKLYTNLNFAGIEFVTEAVDASAMTHFHMDIWTPDPSAAPAVFKIKLVNDVLGSSSEHELTFDAATSPPLVTGNWISFDIPMTDFANLAGTNMLNQLIISGDPNTVYVDNIYFYDDGSGNGGGDTEPTVPAPTPTEDAANVNSVYSDAYTNIDGTDFNPAWGQATVMSEISIAGNNTMKYEGLDYQGIQLGSAQDVSGMENLHLDFWTANSTALDVFLISPGPVETAFTLTVPTSGWTSVDIPLSSFAPVDLGDVIQLKFVGNGDIYLDNIYFHKEGGGGTPTEPTEAAAAPGFDAANVISLFSNPYTDVNVDTWSADWDEADLEDIQIAGDDVKLYTNLNFAGIEFTTQTIDASEMTHFHINVWTPDATAAPAVFKIKLVDFGDNGIWDGGGDDVEHEIVLDNTTTPAMGTGSWITLNVPLSDFTGLTTRGHLAQLIISGDPNTVYVDNILFHK